MGKIAVFDNNKTVKIAKIVTIVILGLLLLWFTFDITGLKLGRTKLVTSAFIDEHIDFVFWLIFVGSIVLFILKDKIGKYVIASFIFLWGGVQFSMYFKSKSGIESYNQFFSDTHHIIAASENFVVKDTYHIILDVLILLAFISAILYIIVKQKNAKLQFGGRCVIGKIVKVTVDRPMGSIHPEHSDIVYPVNYGYIKGIIAPDGEEQDAYILGVGGPVTEFTGKVIAIIHRVDDIEDKWVVVPDGMHLTKEEIERQVCFQEKYFNYSIEGID